MDRKRLKKLYANDPETLRALETQDQTEFLKAIASEKIKVDAQTKMVKIEYLKGEPGYTPVKGEDYFTEPEIIEFKKEVTPVKGVDYFDGEPAPKPVAGIDYPIPKDGKNADPDIVAGIVLENIPPPKNGKDGSPDTGKQIADKLNTTKETVEATVIRGLPTVQSLITELKKGQYLEPRNIKGMPINMNDMRWHGGGSSFTSPLTTKGDLYTFTTADARVGVGTNGQLLSADSTTATGLKWITASGTGTVTSVTSADGNATVANSTTTPVITIVSAPKLATARTINGTSFDGSANITVTADAGTLTGTTLNATVTASSLTSVGTITTGVWSGTIITLAKGGTGADLSGVAKGGLISGTGAGTVGITTVGSDGQVLSADAASAGGVKWIAVSGTGTVTSVGSADGSITVTNPTTTPDLAVVKAPKWSTARLLAGNSVDGSANVAFANKFIVQGTADSGLSAAQFLGALGTGIVKNTTTTGVLSIAIAGDFPTLNQNTTGSAATLTTARTIGGVSFDGSANITVVSATGGFTVSGGDLAIGANNLTLTGSVGATGARATKVWATDMQVTNAIVGSITGNAATVTNATLTTALTVNTGTLTLTANAANTSVLTIGAGAVSISGSSSGINTGDNTVATSIASRTFWGQTYDGTANVSGSLTAVGDITGGASNMIIQSGTGASRTLVFKTTTAGSTATTALTLAADQSATFANTVNATTFIGALTGTASGNLVSGGALGTPSSGTLTNATGLPLTGLVSDTTTALGIGSINLGHASDTTIARVSAGLVSIEGVNILMNGGALGTPSSGTGTNITGIPAANILAGSFGAGAYVISTSLQAATIELGAATDTTLARVSAGVISVEGVTVDTISATNTLTNKRITKRTGTTTSSGTPTINSDNVDFYSLTAQAVDITSFTTNLSGTPTEAQTLWIAITGTAARTITWGSSFEASTVALPTTTVSTNRLDVGFVWNTVTSKWRCVASA